MVHGIYMKGRKKDISIDRYNISTLQVLHFSSPPEAQSVTVKASDFTLDAVAVGHGVSGSVANFGSIIATWSCLRGAVRAPRCKAEDAGRKK